MLTKSNSWKLYKNLHIYHLFASTFSIIGINANNNTIIIDNDWHQMQHQSQRQHQHHKQHIGGSISINLNNNKARTGPWSAARLKPAVHPRSKLTKYTEQQLK